MNARQFFHKVAQMREAQKQYIKTKTAPAARDCVRLENEVDAEIARVKAILEAEQPKQTNLFKE